MEFRDAVSTVLKSEVYGSWKKEHPKSVLSYGFLTIENEAVSPWQIGFFDTESEKITPFTLTSEVKKEETDEVFRRPGSAVYSLPEENVQISLKEVQVKVLKILKEDFGNEPLFKTILIVQFTEECGTMWNVTLFTRSFHTINIKINAQSPDTKIIFNKKTEKSKTD